jgi:hypothetical protein
LARADSAAGLTAHVLDEFRLNLVSEETVRWREKNSWWSQFVSWL